MVLSEILVVFNIIGSHGIDLYVLFGTLWGLASVFMIKYATSVKNLVLILVGITFFDAFVDGFAHHNPIYTDDIAWMGEPWALPWDFDVYPYGSLLTSSYILILWWILVPLRFAVLSYVFIDYYTANHKNPFFTPENKLNNLFIFIIAIIFFISSFGTADHLNFVLRGHIPNPGLIPDINWSLPQSLMHLTICITFGIILLVRVFRAKVRTTSYVLFLGIFFLLVRFCVPFLYLLFEMTITIPIVLYLAYALLVAGMFVSFFVIARYFDRQSSQVNRELP
jgi:hypothetical protein